MDERQLHAWGALHLHRRPAGDHEQLQARAELRGRLLDGAGRHGHRAVHQQPQRERQLLLRRRAAHVLDELDARRELRDDDGELAAAHSGAAIVNVLGSTNTVPPPCSTNGTPQIAAGKSASSWVAPTGVVTASQSVPLSVDINYIDTNGKSRDLVSSPKALTLNPGGKLPKPALSSFLVVDAYGNPATTVEGSGSLFTLGTLSQPAPVGGLTVAVTTSPAGAFVSNGSFYVYPGCTDNGPNWGILTSESSLGSSLAATVTASSGAGTPITKNVTITAAPLAISGITVTPSTVTGGATSVAKVLLSRAVKAGDPTSVTLEVSTSLLGNAQIATFPGCTSQSGFCTGTLPLTVGSSSVSATLSTKPPAAAQDYVTVVVSAPWSGTSIAQDLTINR
jgi:hypothetical protein